MKNLLITGGAGFIGANFVSHMLHSYPDYRIVNLDKLTYAGSMHNLDAVIAHPNHLFIKGDICDYPLVRKIFKEQNIHGVIHFAAESHVDNSIAGPKAFVDTNVVGTFNLLEAAKEYWMLSPGMYKAGFEHHCFLHVSTDEVYGSLGPEGFFTEKTPYAPNSPYSATKAGSDMLVRSYYHTYNLNTVITNCSNNFGPMQHREKLIPTVINRALKGERIPLYGDGSNIRDWIYVTDHCKGVDLVFHHGKKGEVYNIGGGNERTNKDIVEIICKILDELKPVANRQYSDLVEYVADRPGHDFRYAIDATKIKSELGWKSEETFESAIRKTIAWYVKEFSTAKT